LPGFAGSEIPEWLEELFTDIEYLLVDANGWI
jgi:hypothetical protein